MNGVEYDHEEGTVTVTDAAPDELLARIEQNPEYFEAVINFHMTAKAADVENAEPYEALDYAQTHEQRVFDAVENGDLEAAQEHLKLCEMFQKRHEELLEALE